ncbi:hypothetical protein P3S67_022552 [Capsicum chacoense]
MKKKGLAPGGISWSAWKLHLIVVSLTFTIVLCMLAFLSLQRFSPSHSQLPSSMLSRRSLHSYLNFITPHEANPKVAFLFLACRHLPLDFLWNCFLQVDLGEANMIEAERLLLEEALKDLANRRFILLSESCIQLYNFSYVYSYLMASSKSFVDRENVQFKLVDP